MTNTDPVLVARKLGKHFALSETGSRKILTKAIWHSLARMPAQHSGKPDKNSFWAVKNISLSIKPGESYGIIGRNGAGKTTLMKLLTGIIVPDRGTVRSYGNVQAMINLGAGLNPYLDAQANIRNAAAIRGVSSSAIKHILGEVLDFAELGQHAESPVGTYSSGMKARLGFSICVHMSPDVIIIDEALAVGDAVFKAKCLHKLEGLRAEGVAMVLVSHSMTQIKQFCRSAIWVDKGKVRAQGPADKVTGDYIDFMEAEDEKRVKKMSGAVKETALLSRTQEIEVEQKKKTHKRRYGAVHIFPDLIGEVSFTMSSKGKSAEILGLNSIVDVEYSFQLYKDVSNLNVSVVFYREDGIMAAAISTLNGNLLTHIHNGSVKAGIKINDLAFGAGKYLVVLAVHDGASYLHRDIVWEFRVTAQGRMTWEIITTLSYEYEVMPVPESEKKSSSQQLAH